MNYGELKAAVLAESHRPDLAAHVSRFIRRAEGLIASELRAVELIDSATLAEPERVLGGIYQLPAGLLEVRAVYVDGRPALEQVGLHAIRSLRPSAPVSWFAVRGTEIELRGVPAENAEFTVEYFGRPATLADDADTNALLTAHESLYIEGALFYLYRFTQDRELAQDAWDAFSGNVEGLNQQAGRQLGGGSIAGAYNLYGGGGGY